MTPPENRDSEPSKALVLVERKPKRSLFGTIVMTGLLGLGAVALILMGLVAIYQRAPLAQDMPQDPTEWERADEFCRALYSSDWYDDSEASLEKSTECNDLARLKLHLRVPEGGSRFWDAMGLVIFFIFYGAIILGVIGFLVLLVSTLMATPEKMGRKGMIGLGALSLVVICVVPIVGLTWPIKEEMYPHYRNWLAASGDFCANVGTFQSVMETAGDGFAAAREFIDDVSASMIDALPAEYHDAAWIIVGIAIYIVEYGEGLVNRLSGARRELGLPDVRDPFDTGTGRMALLDIREVLRDGIESLDGLCESMEDTE